MPAGERPDFGRDNRGGMGFRGGKGGFGTEEPGEGKTLFYMQDKVNFFSGLTAVTE